MHTSTKKIMIFTFILAVTLFFSTLCFAASEFIAVQGDVKTVLKVSLKDLQKMDAFHINNVTLLKEKKQSEPEKRIGVFNYKGVLLRDILEKAGMKHVRKWEPGVYIRVIGQGGKEVIFSFGEIFYSSIGRSVLIAYEKDGNSVATEDGPGELIVSTDLRSGRRISGVSEIRVERVEVAMQVYDDRTKKIIRPPTSELLLADKRAQKSIPIRVEDLKALATLTVRDAVLTGDCEGFHGVHSFKGASLRSLLEKLGIDSYSGDYDRYVLIHSENGFCATFSYGEIFNSRLSDNIIIAYEKDGKPLDEGEAFAISAAREDSTGGRSVRRISKIEIR